MSEPMSFASWLNLTNAGMTAIREAKLKAVDGALEQYQKTKTPEDKERLRSALMAWITEKGPAWKQDVRNRHNAIGDLYSQVMEPGLSGPKKSANQTIALSHLQNEQRAALDLFRDKELVWRTGFSAKLGNCKWGVRINTPSLAWKLHRLAKLSSASGSSPAQVPQAANGVIDALVSALVPAEIQPEVLLLANEVIPNFMRELTASVIPFVGVIAASAGTVWNSKNAVRNEYRKEAAEKHLQQSLSVGHPEQAIKAIIRIIERERNADAFSASASLGALVGELAGMLVACGTVINAAVGWAATFFKLCNILLIITRDVIEKDAANDLMREGPRITAFQTCPILGAYYVCCVPTSVLVNEIFERWWKGGWRGEVENVVTQHIEPLREQARRLIGEHRFVIHELQRYPGVLVPNQKAIEDMKSGNKMPSISSR